MEFEADASVVRPIMGPHENRERVGCKAIDSALGYLSLHAHRQGIPADGWSGVVRPFVEPRLAVPRVVQLCGVCTVDFLFL